MLDSIGFAPAFKTVSVDERLTKLAPSVSRDLRRAAEPGGDTCSAAANLPGGVGGTTRRWCRLMSATDRAGAR